MLVPALFISFAIIKRCLTENIPIYGQCGGSGGACKICVDGVWGDCQQRSSCQRQSEYYWQCLPGTPTSSSSASLASSNLESVNLISPSTTSPESSPTQTNPSSPTYTRGTTTRYWDCCKPSCGWPDKAKVSSPVRICSGDNSLLNNPGEVSGCDGGPAFACADQTPFVINDNLSYGYAAKDTIEAPESENCCACYELVFRSGPVSGKRMIVQVTNTGGDLARGQFDIAIPGGGQGIFSGCSTLFGSFPGAQYGGVSSVEECDRLPEVFRDGCRWRFGWFRNADNPEIDYLKLDSCPQEIASRTGCVRNDQ